MKPSIDFLSTAKSALAGLYSEERGVTQEEYLKRFLQMAYYRGALDAREKEEDGNE
jgi:hypothetical protein